MFWVWYIFLPWTRTISSRPQHAFYDLRIHVYEKVPEIDEEIDGKVRIFCVATIA